MQARSPVGDRVNPGSRYITENEEQQSRAEQTTSVVELSISCTDLPDCDITSKSDPQVVVYLLDLAGKEKLLELGRTETIKNDLNPRFVKKMVVQYRFEQIQWLRFEVLDIDPLGGNDFLGAANVTLADIITSRGGSYKQELVEGPSKKAHLIIDAEERTSCKQVATFNLRATDLPTSLCGLLKPTVSLNIYRSNEKGTLTIVYRSKPVPRTSNPDFKTLREKLVTLCNGDLDRTIRFELINHRMNLGRNLGFIETTINSLKSGNEIDPKGQNYELMQTSHVANDSRKIIIRDFKLIEQASFLDYIQAGTLIHFVIAIDFTASNGDPAYPDSLHYIGPLDSQLNPYESALLAVGQVIQPYDSMGMYAGFGFGAKLKGPNCPPSHLFALNGNDGHPYVSSLDDLIAVYRQKAKEVILSGPTNFAPCVAHCSSIAKRFADGNHYFVLLILTDGVISDLVQTKKAIIEASKSPMSIIICGVGNAEFTAMNELDSDDAVMKVDGKSAERDIVQFVPVNQFMPQTVFNQSPTDISKQQQLLAEEVLREIPEQLTSYMVARGHHPELTRVTK